MNTVILTDYEKEVIQVFILDNLKQSVKRGNRDTVVKVYNKIFSSSN